MAAAPQGPPQNGRPASLFIRKIIQKLHLERNQRATARLLLPCGKITAKDGTGRRGQSSGNYGQRQPTQHSTAGIDLAADLTAVADAVVPSLCGNEEHRGEHDEKNDRRRYQGQNTVTLCHHCSPSFPSRSITARVSHLRAIIIRRNGNVNMRSVLNF